MYSVFFNILIDLALNMSLHFGVIVVLNSSWSFVTTYFYFLGSFIRYVKSKFATKDFVDGALLSL